MIALDRGTCGTSGPGPGEVDRDEVGLIRSFDPAAAAGPGELDVPDPYCGGDGRLERVLGLVEAAWRECARLFTHPTPRSRVYAG